MKTRNYLFLLILVPGMMACTGKNPAHKIENNSATADKPQGSSGDKYAVIEFEKTTIDLGTVYEGETPYGYFRFKNTGKADLVITEARGSCGCTIPEKPEDPIPPGGEGKIKVSFNSSGRMGENHKDVYITSNAVPNQATVSFTCTVKEKP